MQLMYMPVAFREEWKNVVEQGPHNISLEGEPIIQGTCKCLESLLKALSGNAYCNAVEPLQPRDNV